MDILEKSTHSRGTLQRTTPGEVEGDHRCNGVSDEVSRWKGQRYSKEPKTVWLS